MSRDPDVRDFSPSRLSAWAYGIGCLTFAGLILVGQMSRTARERPIIAAILVALFTIGGLVLLITGRGVALDRRNRVVKTWKSIFGMRTCRDIPFSAFRRLRVEIWRHRKRSPTYHVVLEGPDESVTVGDVKDPFDANVRMKEVAAFIGAVPTADAKSFDLPGFTNTPRIQSTAPDDVEVEEEPEGTVRFERRGAVTEIRTGVTGITLAHWLATPVILGILGAVFYGIVGALKQYKPEKDFVTGQLPSPLPMHVLIALLVLGFVILPIHAAVLIWFGAIKGPEKIWIEPRRIRILRIDWFRWKTWTYLPEDLVAIRTAPSRRRIDDPSDVCHLEFSNGMTEEIGVGCSAAEIQRIINVIRQRYPTYSL